MDRRAFLAALAAIPAGATIARVPDHAQLQASARIDIRWPPRDFVVLDPPRHRSEFAKGSLVDVDISTAF